MRNLFRVMVLAPALIASASGCMSRIAITGGSAQAHEERSLSAAHVSGAGLDVRSGVGSIDVAADPTLKEVSIVAKILATAETEDEAKARLAQVTIKAERRADNVLEVKAEFPKTLTNQPSVSFIVRVPDARGVTAKSGNGSITLNGLGGDANAETGIGAIRVSEQHGAATITSGNGSVTIERATGKVHAKSGIGSVTVSEAGGDVSAQSGNGSVTVTKAGGAVTASSSIGSVKVVGAAGAIDAKSGNGSVHCEPAAGSTAPFQIKSSIGGVSVKLPSGFGGTIRAETSIGTITVNGPRQPASDSGDKRARTIVLSDSGVESKISTGNGSVRVTVE